MSDVDEALIEEVARVIGRTGPDWPHGYSDAARCVVVHLADAGLLVGKGEERVEWVVGTSSGHGDIPVASREEADEWLSHCRWINQTITFSLFRRTVRTWRAPDGTVTTQVGPWVEVE